MRSAGPSTADGRRRLAPAARARPPVASPRTMTRSPLPKLILLRRCCYARAGAGRERRKRRPRLLRRHQRQSRHRRGLHPDRAASRCSCSWRRCSSAPSTSARNGARRPKRTSPAARMARRLVAAARRERPRAGARRRARRRLPARGHRGRRHDRPPAPPQRRRRPHRGGAARGLSALRADDQARVMILTGRRRGVASARART